MPLYLVTMNLIKADSLINIGHLTDIVTEKILPSLDALKDLQSKGKVLAGGQSVGQNYVVLFMEAESEEEVRKLVGELPLSELRDTAVTEFRSFEELRDPDKRVRRRRGLLS
jgi:muconolactone delta-isomerase